jgi:hypothetical protein
VKKILEKLKAGGECFLKSEKCCLTKKEDTKKDQKSSENEKGKKTEEILEKEKVEELSAVPGIPREPRLTPYLCRYVRHKKILQSYLDEVEKETVETVHDQSHKNADAYFFPHKKLSFKFKKGTANVEYAARLATPKKTHVKGTLDEFSQHLSSERLEGLKSRLGIEGFRPEDFEANVRVAPKPKPKIRNLSCKIKNQLSKQIYEQLARILKKKIAREMARSKREKAVTQPMREIERKIFTMLMEMNGTPRSKQECEMYTKFTGVISGFLLKSLQKNLEQ